MGQGGMCWALFHFEYKEKKISKAFYTRFIEMSTFPLVVFFLPKIHLSRNTVFFITVRLEEFKCSIIGKSTGSFKKRLEVSIAFRGL